MYSPFRDAPAVAVKRRRGTAAVEAALVLPFVILAVMVALDWARIFYIAVTLENAARNGAMAAGGFAYQQHTGPGLTDPQRVALGQAEAVKDGTTLNPPLQTSNVTVAVGSSAPATVAVPGVGTVSVPAQQTVSVTVTYTFTPISSMQVPGVFASGSGSVTLSRTVTMDVLP